MSGRVARGDAIGQAPYGQKHEKANGVVTRVPDPERPVRPLIDAYREAGSVLGACRLLDERGVPTARNGNRWAPSVLTGILEREAPDLLPRRTTMGRRPTVGSSPLSSLVLCPWCGATLTPNIMRRQLYCRFGYRDRDGHPKYVVGEGRVMEWVRDELAHLTVPDAVTIAKGDEERRAAIEDEIGRLGYLFQKRRLTVEQYDHEVAALERERDELGASESIVDVPRVEWTEPPAVINAYLRLVLRSITLDETMTPVSAEWLRPEWRQG